MGERKELTPIASILGQCVGLRLDGCFATIKLRVGSGTRMTVLEVTSDDAKHVQLGATYSVAIWAYDGTIDAEYEDAEGD